jgi:myo-inositol-1(or 4)-monophosphatase
MEYFGKDPRSWEKAKGDPVSVADLAVNQFLSEQLRDARPGYGWLSEESEDEPDRLKKERVWVVDPIDGTRAFLRGDTDFSVAVALLEAGKPVTGVVYAPATGDFFTAIKGQGAQLNGLAIKKDGRTDLEGMRLLGEESFFCSPRLWPIPWPRMTFRRINSFALRLAFIADNRCDAAITIRPKADWDLAAADLILSEAGGCCVDAAGAALEYNCASPSHPIIVAGGRALIAPMLERLQPAMERWEELRGD